MNSCIHKGSTESCVCVVAAALHIPSKQCERPRPALPMLVSERVSSGELLQCSLCTSGSGVCTQPRQTGAAGRSLAKCTGCRVKHPHICAWCLAEMSGEDAIPTTCFVCTPREHVCLSKCASGCINRPRPACKCGKIVRLQVNADTNNKGRFFWTCRSCDRFQWDDE